MSVTVVNDSSHDRYLATEGSEFEPCRQIDPPDEPWSGSATKAPANLDGQFVELFWGRLPNLQGDSQRGGRAEKSDRENVAPDTRSPHTKYVVSQ